jgi:transcriptional repressor NrdR
MRCPSCGHSEDKVVDSRESREGDAIRRRRECLACGARFTSYERVEEAPLLIVKKDGRREPFDRNKLLKGMAAACQKRPVGYAQLEELAGGVHARLLERPDREVGSMAVGEMAMEGLKAVDSVAYVRFASVYREFKDPSEFVGALEAIAGAVKTVGPGAPAARADAPPGPRGGPRAPAQAPLFPDVAAPAPKTRKKRP